MKARFFMRNGVGVDVETSKSLDQLDELLRSQIRALRFGDIVLRVDAIDYVRQLDERALVFVEIVESEPSPAVEPELTATSARRESQEGGKQLP